MTSTLYPTAPIWRRVAALIYDSFILLALSFIYGAIVTALASVLGNHTSDYRPMFTGINRLFFFGGLILTIVGFYCYFWRRSGQTIGMKTWHIKVVQSANDGFTPTWKQCLVRALIATPSVLLLGLGYVYAAIQPAKKTPQDLASNTKIIFIK